MRKLETVITSLAVAATLLWAGPAAAQEPGLNRVSDGGFENGVISLSLPADGPFPMFAGGWAARGARLPEMIESGAFAGARSLRVTSLASDPLQVLQDLPLNSRAFGLRVAFWIEEGAQTIRLLETWDRGDPARGATAFAARISVTGIGFTTPAGSWRARTPLEPGVWHALSVIADPRDGTQTVLLDGAPLITLPGDAGRRPTTIVIGGDATAGSFRYDAVEVVSLVDLELAALRQALARTDVAASSAILDRLAAAAAALQRGSEALALPELGVARNMLRLAPAGEDLAASVGELIELIEASDARPPRRGVREPS